MGYGVRHGVPDCVFPTTLSCSLATTPGLRKSQIAAAPIRVTVYEVQGEVPSGTKGLDVDRGADRVVKDAMLPLLCGRQFW